MFLGGKRMLSKKLTFSLTSLIVCLMFAFVATVMGHGDHFSASIGPGELMEDVSTTDHADIDDIQIASGRDRATGRTGGAATETYPEAADPALQLDFAIEFGKVVRLYDFTRDSVTSGELASSGPALGLDDFTVEAFDDLERSLGVIRLHYLIVTQAISDAPAAQGDIVPPDHKGATEENTDPIASLEYRTPQRINVRDPGELPGRQFRLEIFYEALQNAYSSAQGGGFEIHTILVQLGHDVVDDASLGIRQDFLADDAATIAHNEGPKLLRVDLVNDDEGLAQYATIDSVDGATVVGSGFPGVVAVSRVLAQSDVAGVATGPFTVRIVLTEEPAAFTKDHISVIGGKAADPVKLLPIPEGNFSHEDFPLLDYITKSGAPIADNDNTNVSTWTAYTHTNNTTQTPFPYPTGRDNQYHLYTVEITPNANYNGFVTVSVKDFEDKVKPVPNRYDAMTQAELLADSLSSLALSARNVRIKREAISIRVTTGEHQDRADLMAAWKERDDFGSEDPPTGLVNKHPGVTAFGWGDHSDLDHSKVVIPKNGYFVFDLNPVGGSGIADSPWAKKRKLTDEQRLYNSWHVWLSDPQGGPLDLEVFFRNGGTLHLIYKDIPLSTTAKDEDGIRS